MSAVYPPSHTPVPEVDAHGHHHDHGAHDDHHHHQPTGWQRWLLLNPLTIPIESSRALLVHDKLPSLTLWGLHAVVCMVVLCAGWWIFQRTRRGFSDVI